VSERLVIHCFENDCFQDDNDGDRKTQAEVILNTYSRELERQRLYAGSTGMIQDDSGS
jgi:hypothetical protein